MQAEGRSSKVITSVRTEIAAINEVMQINKEKTISNKLLFFTDSIISFKFLFNP